MTAAAPRQQTLPAKFVVALLILAIPAVGYGAFRAMRSTSNDPRQWLPRGFAETETYDEFGRQFGTDEIAVVSWPGATLEDPRVERLATALAATEYFSAARTGEGTLAELTSGNSAMSRRAALRRLVGTLVGPDGETTCIVLTTSPAGQDDRPAAVRTIESLAQSVADLAPTQLKLAGPTVDAAAIDAESRRLLFGLAGVSALVSFAIAALRLRSVAMAAIILAIAVYSTALTLALMHFSGGKMNLLMTMLPPLVYVLTISAAVHLANYYRDALAHRSPVSALRRALLQGWLPCAMAALTTAIGLASLMTSSIDPIGEFGLYAALGVVVGLVLLLVMFPALLTLFPLQYGSSSDQSQRPGLSARRAARARAATELESGALDTPDLEARPPGRLIGLIGRHPILVSILCLAVMVACGAQLPDIKSTVRLQDRFLASSDVIQDYRWLEDAIGPMVPMEIVLRFDAADPRGRFEQMKVVATAQAAIRQLQTPTATISAVNLAPPLPLGRRARDVAERKVFESERTRQRLIDAGFLAEIDGASLWRISVRAPAIGDLDYGLFAERLRRQIDPLLAASDVQGTYTGIIPLIYKAQRQLLMDLFRSFVAAFGVIAVVLVFMLRGVVAACLAMIPNLFPAVLIFGGIESVGIPVQIGSVMTASAALGIAVDDTVHFLTWFRRGMNAGLSRLAALEAAYRHCAGAMIHTTLICAGGLLVFAFSSFVPILHFAWLMVGLLLAALVGDLILLPAMLAGPLGRYVRPSAGRAKTDGAVPNHQG